MKNLHHKVAVAFACTALSCTLGANEEAKAAKFTLTPTPFFIDGETNGSGYRVFDNEYDATSNIFSVQRTTFDDERRAFYEFNIGNFSLARDTAISRAILNVPIREFYAHYRHFYLDLFGYSGNGRADLSDFNAGVRLGTETALLYPSFISLDKLSFDVTSFVNKRVSNRDDFAGFGIRIENFYMNYGTAILRDYNNAPPSLVVETVPEPTTIFGSAIGLFLGGWLKQKKSTSQNKPKSQA